MVTEYLVSLANNARAMGCAVVPSEDLSHGRDYSGVLVEDPFR
jgi:hypothetical protein